MLEMKCQMRKHGRLHGCEFGLIHQSDRASAVQRCNGTWPQLMLLPALPVIFEDGVDGVEHIAAHSHDEGDVWPQQA